MIGLALFRSNFQSFGQNFAKKIQKTKKFSKMDKVLDKFGRPYPPKAGHYYVPKTTTDAIVIKPFTGQDPKDREILMISRKNNPYQGHLALPGGFVDYNEDPKDGVTRELLEETHLDGTVHSLIGAYGDP